MESANEPRTDDKQELIEGMLNDKLMTTEEALDYAEESPEVVRAEWRKRMGKALMKSFVGFAIAGTLLMGGSRDAYATGPSPRGCAALAQTLARRGVTDRLKVDFVLHDRGCRKPYDVWIPSTTQRCSARSHQLWVGGVSDKDRRRNLTLEDCVRFEDGAWGGTRPQDKPRAL